MGKCAQNDFINEHPNLREKNIFFLISYYIIIELQLFIFSIKRKNQQIRTFIIRTNSLYKNKNENILESFTKNENEIL